MRRRPKEYFHRAHRQGVADVEKYIRRDDFLGTVIGSANSGMDVVRHCEVG
jgi:hypothetical protein